MAEIKAKEGPKLPLEYEMILSFYFNRLFFSDCSIIFNANLSHIEPVGFIYSALTYKSHCIFSSYAIFFNLSIGVLSIILSIV